MKYEGFGDGEGGAKREMVGEQRDVREAVAVMSCRIKRVYWEQM